MITHRSRACILSPQACHPRPRQPTRKVPLRRRLPFIKEAAQISSFVPTNRGTDGRRKHTGENAGTSERRSLFPLFFCMPQSDRKPVDVSDGCGDSRQVECLAIEHKASPSHCRGACRLPADRQAARAARALTACGREAAKKGCVRGKVSRFCGKMHL